MLWSWRFQTPRNALKFKEDCRRRAAAASRQPSFLTQETRPKSIAERPISATPAGEPAIAERLWTLKRLTSFPPHHPDLEEGKMSAGQTQQDREKMRDVGKRRATLDPSRGLPPVLSKSEPSDRTGAADRLDLRDLFLGFVLGEEVLGTLCRGGCREVEGVQLLQLAKRGSQLFLIKCKALAPD